ncbi:MAG: zinc-dependent metalloprotease [Prevotellaceae bacterium]|jgi:hypothetical protein|nr:zinc-dependent metalloprotease [Prevotellaceae bacterium]
MKKIILTLNMSIICLLLYGQDNRLMYQDPTYDNPEKRLEILNKRDANVSVDFVKIDLEKLDIYDQFVLQFGENEMTVKKKTLEKRSKNKISFFGKNDDDNSSISFSVLNNDIQGTITTPKIDVYKIETIGDKDNYAIVKLDGSKLKENCDNLHDYSSRIDGADGAESDDRRGVAPLPYGCRVRVLVLYTPAAQSSVSDIKNTIWEAINETNESFTNSSVNYNVEFAYSGLTDYAEVNSTVDKTRFRNTNDGYMDEVHALRNAYAADICVLLTDYGDRVCGEAYDIGVPASDAFCVVNASCATGYYSFGHEIGHLLGCRHDPYVDTTTTPFAYGHGYVYSPGYWRTIMAYADACSSCGRIQYWSNPNVSYEGAAMGTAAVSNSARVWNERSTTAMTFRQPPTDITVTSGDFSSSSYADVIAKQAITTNGTVSISSGKEAYMRAASSITLQPGFSVALGAEFEARVEGIYDCGN